MHFVDDHLAGQRAERRHRLVQPGKADRIIEVEVVRRAHLDEPLHNSSEPRADSLCERRVNMPCLLRSVTALTVTRGSPRLPVRYTPRMETLSAKIRRQYSRDNSCDDIDAALAVLASRKVPKNDGSLLSPVSSIPSKVADLLQLGTRRSIDLAESTIRETNRSQLNSSCVLARAVLETCCLMLYISLQVRHVVQNPTDADFHKLNTFMTNTLVGSGPKAKTFYFRKGYFVKNILTIMEKVDTELGTPFLGFYEGLSEHAHPNAHGMALTYADTQKACVTTYVNQKPSRVHVSLGLAIFTLASALKSADMANQYWDADREAFILLHEKVIYDRGTWPKDTPYPIVRRGDGTPIASP